LPETFRERQKLSHGNLKYKAFFLTCFRLFGGLCLNFLHEKELRIFNLDGNLGGGIAFIITFAIT
jgi:hypothetical protein